MGYTAVAIDGPAGAGKSTVSKAVAKDLGFVYIDTGAMYRAVALYAICNEIETEGDTKRLIDSLDDIRLEIKHSDKGQIIILNGKDVTNEIREEKVSVNASKVAVIKEVREKLVAMQREMAKFDNVIMDGRDISTHVLPNAQVKIFLTASVDARAKRRYGELREKGVDCNIDKIKSDIEFRDKNDSQRQESPLRKADDAVLLDTSDCTFEETVAIIKNMIDEKIG